MNNYFNKEQLSHIKHFLQAQHHELQSQLIRAVQLSDKSDQSELSRIDNHVADYATELFDKERDLALQEHLMTRLEKTEAAIERFNSDHFGLCHSCNQPILYERLILAPEAEYCLEHQPEKSSLPVYEQVANSYSYTNNDEREANFFDGEDTNQALYEYGTSSLSQYQNYNYEFAEEFDDCFQNGVEALEDFVATDITGNHIYILRNEAYKHFVDELDSELETELDVDK